MKPPIKKLSVLFLIGSILTSSLALGASSFMGRADQARNNIENTSGNLASGPDYRIYNAGPNGQNLTDEVISIFAQQLVQNNPEGPQVQEDGLIHLIPPDSADLYSYLDVNPPEENLLTSGFDESRIRIINDFSQSDISRYLSALTQIQSNLSSDSAWQSGIAGNTGQAELDANSWTSSSERALATARDNLYELEVPAPLVKFHKPALEFFSTTASFSSIMLHDPIAAVALSKNLASIIGGQSENLERAAKELEEELPEIIAALPAEERSGIAEFFKIPTAFAQPVPANDQESIWTTISQWAKEFWYQYQDQIKSYSFGFLKNTLIQKIGAKVTEWAKGKGIPGYVTNWLMFQADAALSAEFGLIGEATAKACGNAATSGLYGDVLASALGAPTRAIGVTGVSQTVGETPGCPSIYSGFYSRGGHSAEHFLQSLVHNTYSDLLTIKDRSIRAAGAASQAAVNEALAGRGSLDVKKCDDGTAVDNEGRCADGSPARTITQGSTKQDILSQTVGAATAVITGANNQDTYSAIVQILNQALLTYMLREGEGLFQNSGSEDTTPTPEPTNSIEPLLDWYEARLEIALNSTENAISNYNQAVSILNGSLEFCTEDVALQIIQLRDGFAAAVITFGAEAGRIQGLLDIVRNFQADPLSHTQAELESNVGTAASITALVQRANTDSSNARNDTETAIALFNSCPAP